MYNKRFVTEIDESGDYAKLPKYRITVEVDLKEEIKGVGIIDTPSHKEMLEALDLAKRDYLEQSSL